MNQIEKDSDEFPFKEILKITKLVEKNAETTKSAHQKFIEASKAINELELTAHGIYDVQEIQVIGKEEVMLLPPTKLPPTTTATVTPYQATRQIRRMVRGLVKPHALSLPSMKRLEVAINKRTSKADRLKILEALKVEQSQLFDMNRNYIEQLQVLVQHLPTQENLPSGKAENVLRAIQAVLRNYEKNGQKEEVDF